MKKRNGFTLIELLVTIALMLSILGIAVVSLINISNKKKEEAWQQVKGQIETAAVEYFTANEYLFEGLQNGSSGTISVGKLVNEDYLNKVTNPDTGKAVSMCALVNITKDGEKYNATFDNNSSESQEVECENKNIITVSEPGAPSFEVEFKNEDNEKVEVAKTGWYNANVLGEKKSLNACINIKKNNSGKIIETTIGGKKTDNNCESYKGDSGEHSNVEFTAKNVSGKIAKIIVSKINVDSVLPEGEVSIDQAQIKTWYNSLPVYLSNENPRVVVNANDPPKGSGVNNVINVDGVGGTRNNSNENQFFFSPEIGEFNDENIFTVIDKAGNAKSVSGKYVISEPINCPKFDTDGDIGDDGVTYVSNINVYATLDNSEDTYTANLYGNGQYWLTKTVTNGDGFLHTLTADAQHKYTGYVTNKYGLSKYCESDTYTKDTTPPACPTFTYAGIARDPNAADGTGSCCTNGDGSWRCYSASSCSGGVNNSAVAVYVWPSADTAHWLWLTNQNANSPRGVAPDNDKEWKKYWSFAGLPGQIGGIYNPSIYTLFSDNYPGAPGYNNRKTLTGLQGYFARTGSAEKGYKHYYSKIGFAVVYDKAGNYRQCPTAYVILRSQNQPNSIGQVTTTAPKVKKVQKSNSCSGFATTNNISNWVTVSPTVSNLSNGKTISKQGTSGNTKAVFKFEAKNGASIKNDISGAFCSTKGYCKSVSNHSSWNVTGSSKSRIKKVWCDTTYNCANDWNYVTSCAHVTCGGVTKNVCYRKKTNGGGEFTVVN